MIWEGKEKGCGYSLLEQEGSCYDLLTVVKTVIVKEEFRTGAATEI